MTLRRRPPTVKESVARQAKTDFWALSQGLLPRPTSARFPSMEIEVRRILVPIDFSAHADAVVAWAVHLAEEHGSEIILLHAYHLPVEFQQMEGAYLPGDFWASVKKDTKEQLKLLGDQLRARGLTVNEVTREGYPATVIEEEVERQQADLIVIGSRGRTGLKHMLLGSIAERVVQKAPCPVLTVKAHED